MNWMLAITGLILIVGVTSIFGANGLLAVTILLILAYSLSNFNSKPSE